MSAIRSKVKPNHQQSSARPPGLARRPAIPPPFNHDQNSEIISYINLSYTFCVDFFWNCTQHNTTPFCSWASTKAHNINTDSTAQHGCVPTPQWMNGTVAAAAATTKRMIGGSTSLLDFLQGTWVFDRTMTHTDNGSRLGSVTNASAVFAPVDVVATTDAAATASPAAPTPFPQLLYREEGTVIFAQSSTSTPIPFYREYLYTFRTPFSADVAFWRPTNSEEHLKFFHTLHVSEAGCGATSTHVCIDDLYQATLQVSSASSFSATWVVDGPHKNYSITTKLRREGWFENYM